MIQAGDIRKGNVIRLEEVLWLVVDTQVTYVGKRGAYIQVKMKNLQDQHIETRRFSTSESVEKAFLESRKMVYLYRDAEHFVFMNPETGEQTPIHEDDIKAVAPYLAYDEEVDMEFCNGRPVRVQVAPSVALEVSRTEPAVRGNTATGVTKPAELETGLRVKVPGHIQQGEKIRVDTRTGEFLGRA